MWRIVIQDKASFRYLCNDGDWTHECGRARNFLHVQDAANHCAGNGLKNVYIVFGRLGGDGRIDSSTKTILHASSLRADRTASV